MSCELQTVIFDNYIIEISANKEVNICPGQFSSSWPFCLISKLVVNGDLILPSNPLLQPRLPRNSDIHCLGGVCFFQDTSSWPYPKPSLPERSPTTGTTAPWHPRGAHFYSDLYGCLQYPFWCQAVHTAKLLGHGIVNGMTHSPSPLPLSSTSGGLLTQLCLPSRVCQIPPATGLTGVPWGCSAQSCFCLPGKVARKSYSPKLLIFIQLYFGRRSHKHFMWKY